MKLLTRSSTPDLGAIRLDADPEYARAAEKLRDLRARLGTLETRRTELAQGLNRTAEQDALTRRAERLLVDDVVPLPSELDRAAMRRDLGAVEDEIAVVRRAVELQDVVVGRERLRVSLAICARLRPQHRAVVQRIAAGLTDLVAALEAERDFRAQLNDAGVNYTSELRPMPLAGLGLFNDPADPDSTAARWIREAREYGLID